MITEKVEHIYDEAMELAEGGAFVNSFLVLGDYEYWINRQSYLAFFQSDRPLPSIIEQRLKTIERHEEAVRKLYKYVWDFLKDPDLEEKKDSRTRFEAYQEDDTRFIIGLEQEYPHLKLREEFVRPHSTTAPKK